MPIAAVPCYLQRDDPEFYLSTPPGHRFSLYFPVWGENAETARVDWRMEDRVPKIDKKTKQQKTGKGGPEWEDLANGPFACTIASGKTPQFDDEKPRARKPKADPGPAPWKRLAQQLLGRQTDSACRFEGSGLLRLDAIATAPFATGLGNEHPLENGFAFLNPYGLPYLPGSGVKGVLRQAARELAGGEWGDRRGWSADKAYELRVGKERIPLSVIDVLFGLESGEGDTEHVRGALSFWDVIPQIDGDSLMVEIMTPHQTHYYQIDRKKNPQPPHFQSPHNSGQPNPISFLTVPPSSGFAFHVVCDTAQLARLTESRSTGAPDLLAGDTNWQVLIRAAFEHAFEWLGFGAKTAVGYGAMRRDPQAEAKAAKARAEREAADRQQREAAAQQARRAAMTEAMRRIDDFRAEMAARAQQLLGSKRDKPNTAYHDKARALANAAREGADWTPEERRAAADVIEEWLPKVVQVDMKDERKKLRLAQLRGQA